MTTHAYIPCSNTLRMPAAGCRRIKPGDMLLKVTLIRHASYHTKLRAHVSSRHCFVHCRLMAPIVAVLSSPRCSLRMLLFIKTLNHPQMQRLLLGPVASTVELELRHVGEKASYTVCTPHLLTWPQCFETYAGSASAIVNCKCP